MFELHITPKKEYIEEFKEVCNNLKVKIIGHYNLDILGNTLYFEEMLGIKCESMVEVNRYINTLKYYFNTDNILRIKIEAKINDDFSHITPYTLGTTYYEVHIDIESEINYSISDLCYNYNCAISKNPNKNCFMLTYRVEDKEIFMKTLKELVKILIDKNIKYNRIIKEYCFSDDNIEVDDAWLDTYKELK